MIPDIDEIVDGVYQLTLERPAEGPDYNTTHYRTYLSDLPDDVPTLFDAGHERHSDRLLDRLDTLGIEPERLLISHHHPDHIGGFDAIVNRYGVETWVPELDDLSGTETFEEQSGQHHRFGDGDTLGRVTAVHVGGHTPGSSVFVDEAAGIAVCGDALSGADRRGLPEGYLIHPPQGSNSFQSAEEVVAAERNLDRLLGYEFEIALVYHGSSVLEDASEKLARYIDFEPNFSDPDGRSIHSPDRSKTAGYASGADDGD